MFAGFAIPEEVSRAVLRGALDVEEAEGGAAGNDGFVGCEGAVEDDLDGVIPDIEGDG